MRVQDTAEELRRFRNAQMRAVEQLEALAHEKQNTDTDAAALAEVHSLLVEDEDFAGMVQETILRESCTAEYAVHTAGNEFSSTLCNLNNSYMQARGADILDVSARLIRILQGIEDMQISFPEPVILAALDLAPSDALRLDKSNILGIVTEEGSIVSHTAILARAMGIPAIIGITNLQDQIDEGDFVCLNGDTGELFADPDEATLQHWQDELSHSREEKQLLLSLKGKPDVTLDNRHLRLYCNIGSGEDVVSVRENDGRGIGLFRSEFLFLGHEDLPDEQTQYEVYKAVAQGMEGLPVIIRTLDIGSDKQVSYLDLPEEKNPALGLRGVRVSLRFPNIFKTQLRAIYRASAFGNISIMFPMITSVWEFAECRALCRQVMDELKQEDVPFCPTTEIGVMIETPAAAFIAKELAQEADFFSIGTNDLTQYLLACDRQSNALDSFYDPHHPAVLRAIKMIADAAHAHHKWVGICGELGSDLTLLPVFLDFGIDELSVVPSQVLQVRKAWRALGGNT